MSPGGLGEGEKRDVREEGYPWHKNEAPDYWGEPEKSAIDKRVVHDGRVDHLSVIFTQHVRYCSRPLNPKATQCHLISPKRRDVPIKVRSCIAT